MIDSKIKRLCAVLASFIALECCACSQPDVSETGADTSVAVTADTSASSLSAAAIADEADLPQKKEKQPLRIALGSYGYTYSPFYPEGELDKLIARVTGTRLIGRDRAGFPVMNGASGESRTYNGSYYSYSGIADVSERYDEEADETVCSLKLRDDVCFSDGEKLTADDVIFTLYVLLDPSAEDSLLSSAGIKGEVNYRLNSAIADTLTDEEIKEALGTDEVRELIRGEVIIPALREELEWVRSLYGESSYSIYTDAYPDPKDLMAYFYSVNSEYDSKQAATEEQVISDLADMYGGNYELLGSMKEGDADHYETRAKTCAIAYLSGKNGGSETVGSISGINKTGEFGLDITVKGNSPAKLLSALCDVTVAPLHYYGDTAYFDPSAERFGFRKGSAAELISGKADKPLGAGAYIFDKSENGVVFLSANENYYKGAPLIEKIEVSQAAGSKVAAVADGAADISLPESTAQTFDEIENAGASLEKLAAYTVSSDGYGYIGINAATVNIGGEPGSAASKSLRKALATAIMRGRDDSVREYCGDIGMTADYPAAASSYLIGSELYERPPYGVDVNGKPVYADYMNGDARREAAKAACLDYFEAAGYTVEDQRVTEAPEGGTTVFRAAIAGGGTGDHPSYGALKSASEMLDEIGITLYISDVSDASEMWSLLENKTHEIWALVWETGTTPKMEERYSEGNLFGISCDELSELIGVTAESDDRAELRAAYAGIYRLLFDDWAVEIPVYQRSGCILFSTLRVDTSTVPADMTCYYDWTDEIEKLAQKG